MQLKTHLKINTSLSGKPIDLSQGYAKLILKTDERILADFCAMN